MDNEIDIHLILENEKNKFRIDLLVENPEITKDEMEQRVKEQENIFKKEMGVKFGINFLKIEKYDEIESVVDDIEKYRIMKGVEADWTREQLKKTVQKFLNDRNASEVKVLIFQFVDAHAEKMKRKVGITDLKAPILVDESGIEEVIDYVCKIQGGITNVSREHVKKFVIAQMEVGKTLPQIKAGFATYYQQPDEEGTRGKVNYHCRYCGQDFEFWSEKEDHIEHTHGIRLLVHEHKAEGSRVGSWSEHIWVALQKGGILEVNEKVYRYYEILDYELPKCNIFARKLKQDQLNAIRKSLREIYGIEVDAE